MRKILAIAWNDIKIEFSERSTLVFFLVLPLVFTAIIGLALANTYTTDDPNADNRLVVMSVNLDQGKMGAEFLNLVATSDLIRPVEKTQAEAEALLAENKAFAMLVIPQDFTSQLEQGYSVELSLSMQNGSTAAVTIAETIRAFAENYSAVFQTALRSTAKAAEMRPFTTADEEAAYRQDAMAQASEAALNPSVKVKTTRSETAPMIIATGFEQSSPGQLVTWVLTTLLGGAEVFVNERLGGTLRRLLTTPSRKATILTGKILGRLLMGLAQMALLIGFGALVLKVNWGHSPLALALVALAFALAGTAFGVMLGAFTRTRAQASNLAVMFSMLLAALGGAWWPIEVTPPAFQTAVSVLPSTWAMKGFTDVIIRGQGVAGILPEVGVLLAFAVVFFAIGVWKLKFE